MKVIFFLFIASLFLLFPLSFQAKKATNDITETLKLVILVSWPNLLFYLLISNHAHCIPQIHRHGDRTPISTYPRDPYRYASFWPDGWGELTIVSCKDGEVRSNNILI